MASIVAPQQSASSGSGSDVDQRYAQYDERKRKRMISNRESARRSRTRKQQHLDNLVNEVSRLQNENSLLTQYDERKRKRMISNRESARRSRTRKQQHLDNLVNEVSRLQNENSLLTQRVDQLMQMYVGEMAQKNVVTAQVAELTDRLRSLNMVLEIVAEANGIKLDIPEVPNTSLEPWQLPCPTLPITAPADVFNF